MRFYKHVVDFHKKNNNNVVTIVKSEITLYKKQNNYVHCKQKQRQNNIFSYKRQHFVFSTCIVVQLYH